MDKMEYLKKVFAHTKGKTFENYVINQIWAKVENFGLRPVTQQYVKRQKGYALIDLYLPQISFAIEVDEFAHEKNKILGEIRMEEIFSSITGIDAEIIKEGKYNYVKKQINNVVKKIEEKAQRFGPFEWDEDWQKIEYKEKFKEIKARGKLLSSDWIGFERIQVTNDIFGMDFSKGYLQYGKSDFEISKNENIWFPHLTSNKNWENTVSDDWNSISEEYIGNNKNKNELKPESTHNKNVNRYTFAKYKNKLGETSYRFIGVFKFKEKKDSTFVYEKISDEINI
jgi:hypothetical protein